MTMGPQRITPASPVRIAAEVAAAKRKLDESETVHVGDQIEPNTIVCGQRVITNPAALRSTVTLGNCMLCNQLVKSGRWRKVTT